MRNRFRAQEVWERMGFDVAECLEFTENSPLQQAFRALLFSRIVPCVKDIGLWGEGSGAPSPTWGCSTPPGPTWKR